MRSALRQDTDRIMSSLAACIEEGIVDGLQAGQSWSEGDGADAL